MKPGGRWGTLGLNLIAIPGWSGDGADGRDVVVRAGPGAVARIWPAGAAS